MKTEPHHKNATVGFVGGLCLHSGCASSRSRCSCSWSCSPELRSGPSGAETAGIPSCRCGGPGGGGLDGSSDQEIKSLLVIQLPRAIALSRR